MGTVYRWMIGSPKRAMAVAFVVAATLAFMVTLFPLLRDFAVWLVVSSPLAGAIIFFQNETKQILGRLLASVASLGGWFERQAVKQDLEGTLSLAAERLRDECPRAAVLNFRLDYLRSADEVERLPDGTIVVGIAQHGDRVRNVVAAAWTFVRHGVIPNSRPFIDRDVSQSLDFVLTKSLLQSVSKEAVTEFLGNVWTPAVASQERIRDLCHKLDVLSEGHLMGPILISEFAELATRLGMRWPAQEIFDETSAFVEFLYGLASRDSGEDLGHRSEFPGKIIRVRVIFVARADVYAVKGPDPYRRAIDWAIDRAYHNVYLLASGRNVAYLSDVVAPYQDRQEISSIVQFPSESVRPSGRRVAIQVTRLSVHVRYYVGIGQRPLIAIGARRPTLIGTESRARRRG